MLSNHSENDYEIKLIDFGLATSLRRDRPIGLMCGTPGYVGKFNNFSFLLR